MGYMSSELYDRLLSKLDQAQAIVTSHSEEKGVVINLFFQALILVADSSLGQTHLHLSMVSYCQYLLM